MKPGMNLSARNCVRFLSVFRQDRLKIPKDGSHVSTDKPIINHITLHCIHDTYVKHI